MRVDPTGFRDELKIEPPDEASLRAARERRMKELAMGRVLRGVAFYLAFLVVLLFLAHANVDGNAAGLRQTLVNTFINTKPAFPKVS